MSTLDDFTQKAKFMLASIYTAFENGEELKQRVKDIYDLKFENYTGKTIVQLGVDFLKDTSKMTNVAETKSIAESIGDLKIEPSLYTMVRDFVFDFSKFGPEIYEQLEQGNITPEKQWEIDLKKTENRFLYGNEKDATAREALITALSDTKTPITLRQLSVFLSLTEVGEIRRFLMQNQKEYLNHLTGNGCDFAERMKMSVDRVEKTKFYIDFNKETGKIAIAFSPDIQIDKEATLPAIEAIDIKKVDTPQIADMSEVAMKDYLISGKVEATESLTQKQIELSLQTFIKVAQKFQGFEKIKEKEMLTPYKYNLNTSRSPLYNFNHLSKNHSSDNKEFINQEQNSDYLTPNVLIELTEQEKTISEMPDFSPKREYDEIRDETSPADEVLSALNPQQIATLEKQEAVRNAELERMETFRNALNGPAQTQDER